MNMKIAARAIFRRFLPFFVLFGLILGLATPSGANDLGAITGKPQWQTPVPNGRIVIQLAPDAGLRLAPSGLQVAPDANSEAKATVAARRLTDMVSKMGPDARIVPRMPSVIGKAEAAFYAPLALYGHFESGHKDPAVLAKLVSRLQNDPAVNLAWADPVAIPAVLDFDPGAKNGGGDFSVQADSASASFEHLQGYLGDAPDGIGALSMRAQAGALGQGVTVIDVEGGWLWSHEDLPAPVAQIGDMINSLSWRNHGTAVVGVIRGHDNGLGVTGIVPQCEVGHSSIGSQATSEAIMAASLLLSPGDVIVIELHAAGPEATGSGQEGYVPMEFWQDNFDAIAAVTRQGIMVLEAAGNGQVDLDAPIYQGLFDPALRHSGAIMIGATNGSSLDPAWFSNNGQRVDLNGWGYDVATLAYGDLQGDPLFPEEQWYTASFSGTSSATPVVTGAVVALTGMVRQQHGFDLDARLARDLLRLTGTPANGPQLIGSRPNLVAAYNLAETGIGEISGVVTDQTTGLPIEQVVVSVSGGGSSTLTLADGSWRLPLMVGPVELVFNQFGYEENSTTSTITSGGSSFADMILVPMARYDISGIVYGAGQPLTGALVEPLDQPIAATTSLGDGSFTLPQVPAELEERLLIYGVPGFGARVVGVTTIGATADVMVSPALSPSGENFGSGDGGFVASQGHWTHGAPPASTPGAFADAMCWGIGLDGLGYADDQADTLTSPLYDLSGVPAGPQFLSFHYFADTEANFDGVNLEVSTGGPFTLLSPVEGYSDLFLGGLNQQAGWSGSTNQWRGTVFDISALTGDSFQFRLNFGSDSGVTAPGFFIDGITFGQGLISTPVPETVPTAAAASLNAWPNPFNPQVNIAYTLSRSGSLEVSVFDVSGRRVRHLFNAPVEETQGTLQWNGQDDKGRSVGSGVYLIRLKGADADHAVQRVVLTK